MEVRGRSVLIVGDLHFSDVFEGKHKDYLANCYSVLGMIEKKVNEVDPGAVVILGDLVGRNESNVRNREVFSHLCTWFMRIGSGRKVFCVRGNHDAKGYPDFQFMSDMRLFETAASTDGYFDYYGHEGQETPEVRFHLVDYKQEDRHLDILEGSSNVVLAHNTFTIQGLTTWFHEADGVELAMQQNFTGVDMVVCGHIHDPSPEFYSTQMVGGGECMLFYTGCPTRPVKTKDCYEKCWYMLFKYDSGSDSTSFDTIDFNLAPLSEIFYGDDEFIEEKTEDELAEEIRTQALKEVLGDILKYRMCDGNILESIDAIPNASDEAKELAKKYMQFALNSRQSA